MHSRTATATPADDDRRVLGAAWAADLLGLAAVDLEPVSGDASFRRYFRFDDGGRSVILMDAPPAKEDSAPFVDIAGRLRSAGLNAPEIYQFDLDLGFGLLEDFGDTLYRDLVDEQSVDRLFPELFRVLGGMARRVNFKGLPPYDPPFLQMELDLFRHWYLEVHRDRPLLAPEARLWSAVCERLIESAVSQPQAFVHRDFHSCNLLHTEIGPGLIDFQDGMHGPVNYDLISLIWDRYVAWPRGRLEDWMMTARPLLAPETSPESWIKSCDLMGLQRNLKIVGIFARLKYRDGKDGYLEMIPRFYRYLLDVLPLYPEFSEFNHFLEQDECAP